MNSIPLISARLLTKLVRSVKQLLGGAAAAGLAGHLISVQPMAGEVRGTFGCVI